MEIVDLDSLIAKHKLERVANEIRALACKSIRLFASPAKPGDNSLKVGNSRLGGQPDLPPEFKWPRKLERNFPMSFVAQICLEDVAGFAPAQDLPASGLLSFFYDSAQDAHGGAPNQRGNWDVIFFEPAAPLKTYPFPDDLTQQARFSPLAVRFENEWTLPTSPAQGNPGLMWSEPDQQAYQALLGDFYGEGNRKFPRHRMFGWPDQIQGDMQLQAAMMWAGINDMNDPREEAAARNKLNWQLLLQVDSDDRAGMRWASDGMIYYWIEQQALKERQYNQTWLILQSV